MRAGQAPIAGLQQVSRHAARLAAPHAATLTKPMASGEPADPRPRRKGSGSMQIDFAEMQLAEDLRILTEEAQPDSHDNGEPEAEADDDAASTDALLRTPQVVEAGLARSTFASTGGWTAEPPPGHGMVHRGHIWASPAAVANALGVPYHTADGVAEQPRRESRQQPITQPGAQCTQHLPEVPPERMQQLPGKLRDHIRKVDALRRGQVTAKAFCEALAPLAALSAPALPDAILQSHIVPRIAAALQAAPQRAGAWSCVDKLARVLARHPRLAAELRAHKPAQAAASALLADACHDGGVQGSWAQLGTIAAAMRSLAVDCQPFWTAVGAADLGSSAHSAAPCSILCAACELPGARECVAASPELQQRLSSAAAASAVCLAMHDLKQLAAQLLQDGHWAAAALHPPMALRLQQLQQRRQQKAEVRAAQAQAASAPLELGAPLEQATDADATQAGASAAAPQPDEAEQLLARLEEVAAAPCADSASLSGERLQQRSAPSAPQAALTARCKLLLAWAAAWRRCNPAAVAQQSEAAGWGAALSADAWSATPPLGREATASGSEQEQVDREVADKLLGLPGASKRRRHPRRGKQQRGRRSGTKPLPALKAKPQMRHSWLARTAGGAAQSVDRVATAVR